MAALGFDYGTETAVTRTWIAAASYTESGVTRAGLGVPTYVAYGPPMVWDLPITTGSRHIAGSLYDNGGVLLTTSVTVYLIRQIDNVVVQSVTTSTGSYS